MVKKPLRRAIIAVFAFAAAGGVAFSGEKSNCEPSFLEIADSPVSVKVVSGLIQLSVNAALIGCRASLAAVTPPERKALEAALLKLLENEGRSLERSRNDPHFRATMVAQLNAAIGRRVASDVHLFDFGFLEFEPNR